MCVYFKLRPLALSCHARHSDSCFHTTGLASPDLPGHVVDDGGEVGGAVETHRLETLVVGLHHALDAAAVRVLWVAVLKRQRKTHKQHMKHVKTYEHHHAYI